MADSKECQGKSKVHLTGSIFVLILEASPKNSFSQVSLEIQRTKH